MFLSNESPKDQIAFKGFFLKPIELPAEIQKWVRERNWPELDRAVRRETIPGGGIFEELLKYASFREIEFIISIRSSLEFPDEDGIWHDDGSRLLAFSLSLTLDPDAIEGGRLEIRKKINPEGPTENISTPVYGTLIVFATGSQGFEHKINRVVEGERIIIAGWCT